MPLNIVLVEPEIPQNTGNIARTCAATGSNLHLVGPLGFSIEDRYLKRAGLDYWEMVNISLYESLDDFFLRNSGAECWYISTKAGKSYSGAQFGENAFLFFGKETRGLPEDLLMRNYDKCLRIPMTSDARSLNISNAAAIVIYEALRQQGFPGLMLGGRPAHFT